MDTMTQLVEALQQLGLEGEQRFEGRWVKLQGERCSVYVIEAEWGKGYYTWCDDPQARTVECYPDALRAIRAGLRRAARGGQATGNANRAQR